jgi:hypothetical protein
MGALAGSDGFFLLMIVMTRFGMMIANPMDARRCRPPGQLPVPVQF